MPQSSFDVQRERGAVAERAVARWLQTKGWRVLPVYDFSGKGDDKAPKLAAFSAEDSLVTPDLLIARRGLARWVEVKFKTAASYTFITGTRDTGISLRLWGQYGSVGRESGLGVFLCFAHETEDSVTLNSYRELMDMSPRLSRGPDRGGSVLWPLAKLRRIASYREIVT